MKSWYPHSNPTNIATGLAAGFRIARRAYGNYKLNETNMARSGFRSRKRFRRGGSRTTTRRRRFRRGNRLVKRVRRINRLITRKGLRHVETKYEQNHFFTPNTIVGIGAIATLLDNNQSATSAQVSFTAGTAKGTARNQRIGNKIFIRALRFRALLQMSQQANAVSEVYVTLMLLRVKNAQGAVSTFNSSFPYYSNIFELPGDTGVPPAITNQDGGRGAFVNSFHYYNNRFRNDFTILKKRTYKIAKDTGSGDNKRLIRWNVRVNKPAFWDDNNNTGDGHLYLYYWCDQTTTGDGPIADGDRPVMYAGWRWTFTDV